MEAYIYAIMWTVLVIVFGIVELSTMALVAIWFLVGALVALIVSFVIHSLAIQIMVFILVTVLSLIFTKPILEKKINKSKIATNVDAIVGLTGTVKEAIYTNDTGLVKVKGQVWSARSENNQKILQGKTVTVTKVEGVTLLVRSDD